MKANHAGSEHKPATQGLCLPWKREAYKSKDFENHLNDKTTQE